MNLEGRRAIIVPFGDLVDSGLGTARDAEPGAEISRKAVGWPKDLESDLDLNTPGNLVRPQLVCRMPWCTTGLIYASSVGGHPHVRELETLKPSTRSGSP